MLTKTSIHAIRAVVHLATLPPETYAGTAKLAEKIGAPPNYLGKLLQLLAREGVLVSQKGITGGFRLARPAEEIRLLDIVEPLEQVSRWSGCILGLKACSDEHPCKLHFQYGAVRQHYLDLLRQTSVGSLVPAPEANE